MEHIYSRGGFLEFRGYVGSMKETQFSSMVGDKGSTIPSILNVADFFFARAPEVVKLYNAAKPRVAVISNHLRRRLRSFKPYHDRPKLGKSKAVFPRKISRRTRRLRRMYLREEDDEKSRLPATHVWHAKRFKMENLWSMRLPTYVSNKGARAILRLSRQSCLVHDRSYIDCWRLVGVSKESIGAVLIEKGFSPMVAHERVMCGHFFGSGFISDGGHVVSPYQAVWGVSVCSVDIYTHPSARPEVQPLMESIGGQLRNQQVRFELIGARTESLFEQVLGVNLASFDLIPGKVQRVLNMDVMVNLRAGGSIIELIFGENVESFYLWRQFVRLGASPIGVLDRHNLMTHVSAPDFPFNFPSSKAGARQIATQAKKILLRDQARPKHCKLNSATVESPYFPDWTLIGCERVPLLGTSVPVTIQAVRGVLKFNAHVYMDNKLIGFVISTCGDAESLGIAHVNASCIGTGNAVYRNPGSEHSLPAIVSPCIHNSTDSVLIGMNSCNRL